MTLETSFRPDAFEALDASVGKLPFDPEGSRWCYVVVRGDIPAGLQGAQAIHAALEAGRRFGNPEGLRVSFLKARDGRELLGIRERLEEEAIPFADFHEPDWDLGFSALATAPISRSQAKPLRKARPWRCCGAA